MSPWGRNGDHPGPLLTHRTPSPPHYNLNLTRWPLQPYPIRPPVFPPTHWSSYVEVIRHQRGHGQERNQNAHVRLRHSQTLSAWQARCKSSTSATAHRFRVPNNANLSVYALSLCAPQMPSCSIFTAPPTAMKIDEQRRQLGEPVPAECAGQSSGSGDHPQQYYLHQFSYGSCTRRIHCILHSKTFESRGKSFFLILKNI